MTSRCNAAYKYALHPRRDKMRNPASVRGTRLRTREICNFHAEKQISVRVRVGRETIPLSPHCYKCFGENTRPTTEIRVALNFTARKKKDMLNPSRERVFRASISARGSAVAEILRDVPRRPSFQQRV